MLAVPLTALAVPDEAVGDTEFPVDAFEGTEGCSLAVASVPLELTSALLGGDAEFRGGGEAFDGAEGCSCAVVLAPSAVPSPFGGGAAFDGLKGCFSAVPSTAPEVPSALVGDTELDNGRAVVDGGEGSCCCVSSSPVDAPDACGDVHGAGTAEAEAPAKGCSSSILSPSPKVLRAPVQELETSGPFMKGDGAGGDEETVCTLVLLTNELEPAAAIPAPCKGVRLDRGGLCLF